MGCCRSHRIYKYTVGGAEDAPGVVSTLFLSSRGVIKSNFNDKSLRSNFCTRVVCCVCFSFRHRSVLFYFYTGCVFAPQESEKAGILRREKKTTYFLTTAAARIKARAKSFMSRRRLSFIRVLSS